MGANGFAGTLAISEMSRCNRRVIQRVLWSTCFDIQELCHLNFDHLDEELTKQNHVLWSYYDSIVTQVLVLIQHEVEIIFSDKREVAAYKLMFSYSYGGAYEENNHKMFYLGRNRGFQLWLPSLRASWNFKGWDIVGQLNIYNAGKCYLGDWPLGVPGFLLYYFPILNFRLVEFCLDSILSQNHNASITF